MRIPLCIPLQCNAILYMSDVIFTRVCFMYPPCRQAHIWVTHMSGKEQSNLVGWSLVKRCQESEPAMISVISVSPEWSEIPLAENRKRRENCQIRYVLFLMKSNPMRSHGVTADYHNKKSCLHISVDSGRVWCAITDIWTKILSVSR